MEHLNWGYIQLGLVALIFGGLQVWWISSVFWRRDLARPQSGGEFRKSLERIWKKEQRQGKSGNGCVSIWSRGEEELKHPEGHKSPTHPHSPEYPPAGHPEASAPWAPALGSLRH